MNIYFSGIGGVGIGPLAMLAIDGGYHVEGSDLSESPVFTSVAAKGAVTYLGQDGSQIATAHQRAPIDWLVYSSALPDDHPELLFAKQHGIKISKRDVFLTSFLEQKRLRMVAVAGTHGKTTTTGMVVWLFKQLELPVSYSIGTTISFGEAAEYAPTADFFVYECDEFDRNFLHFHPHHSLITSLDYDHPDTYPTEQDYKQAFVQFIEQSNKVIAWRADIDFLDMTENQKTLVLDPESENIQTLQLPGDHNRRNAWLAIKTVHELFPDLELSKIIAAAESFPGTHRRFELLQAGIYSDYAHHPAEIAATLQMAREINQKVVVVYQPHQNLRQKELQDQYKDCFAGAKQVFWLPTYLSREPNADVLSPHHLVQQLADPSIAEVVELDETLAEKIALAHQQGALVLFMGAGDIDAWARQHFSKD